MRNIGAKTAFLVCFLAFAFAGDATRYEYNYETCKAAKGDYDAAQRLGGTGSGPRGAAAYFGAMAAAIAASRKRIPVNCNCLVALAAAEEAIFRNLQAKEMAQVEANWTEYKRFQRLDTVIRDDAMKAYRCFDKRRLQAQAKSK